MENLSLVSLDDLFKEISNRYDIWIFSGTKFLELGGLEKPGCKKITTLKFKGDTVYCKGLASQAMDILWEAACDDDSGNFDEEVD